MNYIKIATTNWLLLITVQFPYPCSLYFFLLKLRWATLAPFSCGAHFPFKMRENWKREQIPDHKFDYIDTDDFKSKSLSLKLKYSYVFFKTVRAILVYMADMGIIVITLISFNELKKILTTNSSPVKK